MHKTQNALCKSPLTSLSYDSYSVLDNQTAYKKYFRLILGVKTCETHEWRKTVNTKKPLRSQYSQGKWWPENKETLHRFLHRGKPIFSRPLTTFKVKENSRTFQWLTQKFRDFSRLCEPCIFSSLFFSVLFIYLLSLVVLLFVVN